MPDCAMICLYASLCYVDVSVILLYACGKYGTVCTNTDALFIFSTG